jgi:hypothetical protein
VQFFCSEFFLSANLAFITAYAIVDPNATLPINIAVESMAYPDLNNTSGTSWSTQDVFGLADLHDNPVAALRLCYIISDLMYFLIT